LQQQFEAGLLTPPRDAVPIEPEVEHQDLAVPPTAIPIDEPPPEPVPLPPAGPTEEELRAEWIQIVAALQADEQRLQSQLEQAEAAAVEEEAQAEALQTQLQDLRRRRSELRQATTQLRDAGDQSTQRRAELERELSRIEAELRRVRAERAQAAGQYSIVPYDGQSGTNRRPIIIECTETGLSFAAEGVDLTPQQLNGFTPTYNPLLAGTEALITYWSARDLKDLRSGQSAGRPYVLLVVRPGGTTGYYVARRLLEGLDQPFGYELVTDEQQFAWPETDPAAVSVCRQAVDAMVAQRDRLVAQTRSGRLPVAAQLQFADRDGRFYLEEVERLRRGQKMVNVGGRQFERAPLSAAQSAPRIVDIPRGGAPAAGGIRAPRRLEPATTAHALQDPSNNVFESAVGTHHESRSATGVPGEAGSSAPADDTGLNGDTIAGGESRSSGVSGTDRDVASDGGTGAARDLPAQSNVDSGGWTYPDSNTSSRSGTQGGWEPHGKSSQQAGRNGSNAGPAPPFGLSASGDGADMSRPQVGVLRSAGGGQTSRDAETDIRHWGVREIGSSIGLEREVVVRVGAEEVRVAGERPIKITSGISREDLQEQLAGRLDAHVRGWGRPPKSFYWLPTIRFQVLPGGIQYQERLSSLTDNWGLRSNVEQVLE
jgi:hypothetical protein